MSEQFGLFDTQAAEAPDSAKRARFNFRPANMRTVHGIRNDDEYRRTGDHSVSCVECVENYLFDGHFVRESGGGLDAPEDLPRGSVKAMFVDETNGVSSFKRMTGICQRTYARAA
jgi:hypothetical protein